MDNEEISRVRTPWRWRRALLRLGFVVLVIVGITVVNALHRGWEELRRMDCASNLKQLGLLCRMYADRNGGAFPSRWSDLATIDYATNSPYSCPSAGHRAGKWEEVDLWTDYRLMPNLRTNAAPDAVLAIESLANHHGEGANVLFADGRVQWLTVSKIENWRKKAGMLDQPNDLAWMTTAFTDAQTQGVMIDFPEIYVKDTPTGPRWSGGAPTSSPQWDETAFRALFSKLSALSKEGKIVLYAHEDTSVRTLQKTIDILHEYGFDRLAVLGRIEGVHIAYSTNTLERVTPP